MADDLNAIFADAAQRATDASDIAHTWANGDNTTLIPTESGDLPSLAKYMFDTVGAGSFTELEVNLVAGNATLTPQQLSDNAYFKLIGNTVARTVTLPATPKLFYIQNTGTSVVDLVNGTTTIKIAPAEIYIIYSDGNTDGLVNITDDHRVNFYDSIDPTVNDDVDSGYSVFSLGINTSSEEAFICLDNTSGAAVWRSVTDVIASDISYSNATSGLVATSVQSAIDEVEGRVEVAETKLAGVESGATADQVASEVPNTPSGNISSTDIQSAINELDTQRKNKNYIINGNFNIWQRGETLNLTSVGYTADRWTYQGSTGTFTAICSKETDTDGKNWLRLRRNTATTDFQRIEQRIEMPEHMKGKTFTVSYKIKFNSASNDAYFYYQWVDGTGINGSYNVGNGVDVSQIGVVQEFKQTITLPTNATNHSYFRFAVQGNGAIGTVDYDFEITDFQIEEGSVATDFEYRHIAEELALCQRYFKRVKASSVFHAFAQGVVDAANDVQCVNEYWYGMRLLPSFSSSGSFLVEHSGTSSATPNAMSFVHGRIVVPTSTATTGSMAFVRADNDINAYLDFDAEL